MSDEYETIFVRFLGMTAKAVRVRGDSCDAWIPRSVIHAACESKLGDLDHGDEFHLKAMAWCLKKSGLT